MCGILGFVHRDPEQRPPLSEQALSRLAHRGPDGTGVFTDAHAQFGHTRLSIIDLTNAGHQPMLSHNNRYVVTYNGEIYNYLELRAELEALGESFTSHSDTEVLLAAYHVWGAACVQRFRGMFAFVLWDTQTKTAFLARDRCGEKQDVERKREKDEGHNLPDGPFPNNQNDGGEGKRGQQHGC